MDDRTVELIRRFSIKLVSGWPKEHEWKVQATLVGSITHI
jgi:hypothetical protein